MDALTVVLRVEAHQSPLVRDAVVSVFASTHLPQALVLAVDHAARAEVEAALPNPGPAAPTVEVVGVAPDTSPGAVRVACLERIRTPLVLRMPAVARLDPTLIEKAVWALAGRPDWSFVTAGPALGEGMAGALAERLHAPDEILRHLRLCPVNVCRLSAWHTLLRGDPGVRGVEAEWDAWLRLAATGRWGSTLAEPLVALAPAAGTAEVDDPGTAVRSRLRQRYPALWAGRFAGVVRQPQSTDVGEPSAADLPAADPTPADPSHLLLLVPWLNLGGADRFNLTLTAELVRRGYRVTIATTNASQDPWRDQFRQHTADLFSLPRFLAPEQQPVFLRHLIHSRGIGLCLISHSMLGYGCLPFLRQSCPQTVFVDYTHFVASDWESGGFAGMAHQNQRQLDLNLVSSAQLKAWMVTRGSDAERITVVRTGQDVAALDPRRYDRPALRAKLGISDGTVILLYPARLDPQKRPAFALDVLMQLQAMEDGRRSPASDAGPSPIPHLPPWLCLIAGDGPQRRLVEGLIRRRGLGRRVRMLGAIHPEQMPELYAASDLLFLPSQDEGISLALLEAMSMGLPVVAADVGGQHELVTADTGVLVGRGRAERAAYAAALADLIPHPQRRQQWGMAGRARVEAHFELQQSIEALLGAFAHARRLQREQPRTPLTQAAVDASLASLVADLRADRLQERLRGAPALTSASTPSPLGRLKQRVLRPLYDWALQNGFDSVVPLASWLLRRFGHWLR